MSAAALSKNLLCPQVKRSPSKWLWQRRWDQNHPEDHVSRGRHPEARKLRETLAFRLFRFQTAGLQVAATDGLQGETGKSRFRNPKKNTPLTWQRPAQFGILAAAK